MIESDLAGIVPESEIQKIKKLDETAQKNNERTLNVPTFFAWGKT